MTALRVLIVDDDALVRRALERTLRPLSPVIESFGSGEEAIERALEAPFDVAILDLQMPGLDGVEVAKRLRAHKEDLRIVFITANTTSTFAAAARQIRSEGILTKPWTTEAVLKAVRGDR